MKNLATVLGAIHCTGISKKTKKKYDIKKILVMKPARHFGDLEAGSSMGYNVDELSASDSAYDALQALNLDYPAEVEIELSVNPHKRVFISKIQ